MEAYPLNCRLLGDWSYQGRIVLNKILLLIVGISACMLSGCSNHMVNRTVYEGLFTFFGDRNHDSMFLKDGTADCARRPNLDYADYVIQKQRYINEKATEFDMSLVDGLE